MRVEDWLREAILIHAARDAAGPAPRDGAARARRARAEAVRVPGRERGGVGGDLAGDRASRRPRSAGEDHAAPGARRRQRRRDAAGLTAVARWHRATGAFVQ